MNEKILKALENKYIIELRAVDDNLKTYLENNSDTEKNLQQLDVIDKLIDKMGNIQMKMGKILAFKKFNLEEK